MPTEFNISAREKNNSVHKSSLYGEEVLNPLLQTKGSQANFAIRNLEMEFTPTKAETPALHSHVTICNLPHLTFSQSSRKASPEGAQQISPIPPSVKKHHSLFT